MARVACAGRRGDCSRVHRVGIAHASARERDCLGRVQTGRMRAGRARRAPSLRFVVVAVPGRGLDAVVPAPQPGLDGVAAPARPAGRAVRRGSPGGRPDSRSRVGGVRWGCVRCDRGAVRAAGSASRRADQPKRAMESLSSSARARGLASVAPAFASSHSRSAAAGVAPSNRRNSSSSSRPRSVKRGQ